MRRGNVEKPRHTLTRVPSFRLLLSGSCSWGRLLPGVVLLLEGATAQEQLYHLGCYQVQILRPQPQTAESQQSEDLGVNQKELYFCLEMLHLRCLTGNLFL